MKIKIAIISILIFFAAKPALAHCPLCTLGAGAAALGASWLGVGAMAVGVWLGAFALALGLWMAKIIRKKFFPFQDRIIAAAAFLGTILPLLPLMREDGSVYIFLFGDYGTLLNRTYVFNKFGVGAAVGAAVLCFMPLLSRRISKWRGKTIPYQGMIMTFIILLISSLAIELL